MTSESRYFGLAILPPGPLNPRHEYAPRTIPDGDLLERLGLTREYEVTQGERIDVIAYHELGDARRWPIIADLNPAIDPLFLRGGDILRLPRPEALA